MMRNSNDEEKTLLLINKFKSFDKEKIDFYLLELIYIYLLIDSKQIKDYLLYMSS